MHYWADVHLLSLKKQQQDFKWLQIGCFEKQTVLFSDHWSIALMIFFFIFIYFLGMQINIKAEMI